MKKQYYVSKEHNFKHRVVLFHDGEPVSTYDGWEDAVYDFIKDIEKQGYTKGYLPSEVKAEQRRYKHMQKNMINFDDRDPVDILVEEVLGNEQRIH